MRRHEEDDLDDHETLGEDDALSARHSGAQRQIPLFAYIVLVAAVLAVSSAAVAFKELEQDVPPLTAAAWRLQLTSVVLVPLFVWKWRGTSAELHSEWMSAWKIMLASGVCLAFHFGTWIWGLNRTTLPHALLFVTSTPILIATGSLILRMPISRGEMISAAAGFCGMLLCEVSTASKAESNSPSLVGDVASLAGAICIIRYLQAGRVLRAWMPLFLYALPVTAVAAVLLTLAAVAIENAQVIVQGATGIFGYFNSQYFGLVLFLACGPGIVGHCGFNALLRFFPPLVISMAFPLEPILGSMLGAIFGVSGVPGVWTFVGGFIMVAALIYCTYIQGQHNASVEKKRAVHKATQDALGDDHLVEMSAFAIVENDSDDPDLDEV